MDCAIFRKCHWEGDFCGNYRIHSAHLLHDFLYFLFSRIMPHLKDAYSLQVTLLPFTTLSWWVDRGRHGRDVAIQGSKDPLAPAHPMSPTGMLLIGSSLKKGLAFLCRKVFLSPNAPCSTRLDPPSQSSVLDTRKKVRAAHFFVMREKSSGQHSHL